MMASKSRLFSLLLACSALSLGLIATAATAANSEGAIIGDRSNDDDATLLDASNSNDPSAKRSVGGGGSSSSSSSSSARSKSPTLANPTLNEKSVVLITGAAGFIGSELALALRRTYNVKKMLLVDNLGIDSENEAAYVPPSPKDDASRSSRAVYEKMSEEELSMFEIKRQRVFRIFQELTAASTGLDGDEGRGGAAESIRFYRADMRPSIPEFFDFGEVPLLEGIFQSHPDITHVVHLADVPVSAQNQAIPRNKDSIKTGRMEGLLEEMRLMLERAAAASDGGNNDEVQLPQFVYSSSHEVYDKIIPTATKFGVQQPNPPPFREDKPITTPSTLHGTAKLIDEVLASAYHSTHGIYSVGLRFFNVYGPWNAPGTEIFDLAERLGGRGDSNEDYGDLLDIDVKDYIYIDDAVDGIMSAMQYRPPGPDPPPPVVFNVGTGEGHTPGQVRDSMAKHFPKLANEQQRSAKENANSNREPTKSIASPTLSEFHLGFKAQVSLEEGLAHTLTWHRDRTYPYGRNPDIEESFEQRGLDAKIAASLARSRRAAGVGGEDGKSGQSEAVEEDECSPLDRECLRGASVFPCASECRRSERCTPSAWDDVVVLSKMVTSGCDAVLYTVLLDEDAEQILSATTTVSSTDSSSFSYIGSDLPEDVGRRTQARCNIAFVSEKSLLVKRLMSEGEEYLDEESTDTNGNGLPPLLRHGFWTVLPVSTPSTSSWMHAFGGTFALEYLPKVSPGQFFGSSVRYAIYTAPTVLVENLPSLLKRMENGPPSSDESSTSDGSSSTTLMLASKRPTCDPAQRGSSCTTTRSHQNDMIQSRMYNMIRIALRGDILGGALAPVLDSSFVIHSLREEDSRLFRCDVYGETALWGASSDDRALEFIVSLHDLWAKAVAHWTGVKPWWADSGNKDPADDHEKDDALESGADVKKMEQEVGTWMGILSSSEVQLFTHIIPSEGMGIVHLE